MYIQLEMSNKNLKAKHFYGFRIFGTHFALIILIALIDSVSWYQLSFSSTSSFVMRVLVLSLFVFIQLCGTTRGQESDSAIPYLHC
jgi:hypothetical protein